MPGFLWTVLQDLENRRARVETRRIGNRSDLADLLPVRYLTFRAVRGRDLLGGGELPLLEQGGRALAFVSRRESEMLRDEPIAGLSWIDTRPLASGNDAVVAVFERA